MFGLVTANLKELTPEQKRRYNSVYCGICRAIREQSSQLSRLALSYDMAFLALLLMSLYEPEETGGDNACALHPIHPKSWLDNPYIRYAADMNVALGYYNALDNWHDDRALSGKMMASVLSHGLAGIRERYPRQCEAIAQCIERLSRLEKENCGDIDAPANCFGTLMGELLVYREDLWAPNLRRMGMALGRFVYLADAAVDYRRDRRKKKYNPYLAVGMQEDWQRWDGYLVLAMGSCTKEYEILPLVQDKPLLDNILYSGVWCNLRERNAQEEHI